MATVSSPTVSSGKEASTHAQEVESKVNKADLPRRWTAWWPEMLAVLVGIASLLAVVGFLVAIDGRSLESATLPGKTKPATMLSILITIHRISLSVILAACLGQLKWSYFQDAHSLMDFEVFDNASRGIWGGLVLILSIRWRAILASIGAVVTILLLAVEPFTQTMLYYQSQDIANGSPSIRISKTFDFGSVFATNGVLNGQPLFGTSGYTNITSSLFAGLSNTSTDNLQSCPSGNCTFSTFSTLGVCSHCQDVSASLSASCYFADEHILTDNPYGNCTYITPANATLYASYKTVRDSKEYDYADATLWDSVARTNTTSIFDAPDSPVFALSSIWLPNGYVGSQSCSLPNCTIPTPRAYDCALRWCEQEINAEVRLGQLTENVVSRDLLFPGNGISLGPGSINCSSTSAVEAGYVSPPPLSCDTLYSTEAYRVNVIDADDLHGQLSSLLVQNLSSESGGALTAQYLYGLNSGNLSATMEQIALALSRTIRDSQNATAFTDGDVLYTTTIVRVAWGWIAYPSALLLCCVLLLAGTLLTTRLAWKTSSLAVLFHGPLHEDAGALSGKEMESAAKGMKVRLEISPEGALRLVQVGPEE